MVPYLRALSLAGFAWGLATLLMLKLAPPEDGEEGGGQEMRRAWCSSRIFRRACISWTAGPDGKLTRQDRMRDVVEGILQSA